MSCNKRSNLESKKKSNKLEFENIVNNSKIYCFNCEKNINSQIFCFNDRTFCSVICRTSFIKFNIF